MQKERVATISILANVFLAGSKIIIGFFSGSIAVLAGGLDSFADIFSSTISYIGIKLSGKPADEEHPYGHYKFEVLGGVIITIIVLMTGVGIIYKAFQGFFEPKIIDISYVAIGIMIFSMFVNETMARLKIYYGKKESSVSLLSDGAHSRIDVYTSLAILVGLFFAQYWIYADSVLALFMGIYIVKEAFEIGKEAAGSLLDVSAGEEIEREILSIAKTQDIETSSLKTQKKGSIVTANLEIKLPKDLKLEQATKISDKLRTEMREKIPSLQYIAIQIISHEVETGFYKPVFGKGLNWQRKGKFIDKIKDATGKGPDGYCVCEKCNYKIIHKKGIPCSEMKCPKCNVELKRGE